MTELDPKFDAPELKTALQRALGRPAAPDSLRDRIRLTLEEADAPIPLTQSAPSTGTAGPGFRQLLGGRRMAMAAAIGGLVLGIGLYVLTSALDPDSPTVAQATPTFIQTSLLHHDQLQQAVASGRPIGQGLFSYAQFNERVRRISSRELPSANLPDEGWRLVGGKDCGDCCVVAQLFYTRGHQTLSIFVIPGDSAGRGQQLIRCAQMNGHVVAMRNLGTALLCVVGHCPEGKLQLHDIDRIADLLARR